MSQSLSHFLPLKQIVNSHVKSAGFVPSKGGSLRRDVGDVSWFFEFGRPFDYKGLGAQVAPSILIGSQAWMDKVGTPLTVGPGSTQLRASLVLLPGDLKAPGLPIDDKSWEASAARIVDLWDVYGLPFLESVRSTENLIQKIKENPWMSPKARERDLWEAEVWEGLIDPKVHPFVSTTPRREKREYTLEEGLAQLRQERLNRTSGTS